MSGISRDFTRKSVHELRDIIKKNVDDEGQFGFFDWFQDTFLMQELNIQNYVNNVNEYHAKMVDKHNVGSSEFDKILERVHSVDTNYASRLNRLTDQVNALSNRVMRMANMLNPSVITANSSDYAKLSEGIRVKYQNVKVQSNTEIEKCKQSMPLLYDKQWYENAADGIKSGFYDEGQKLEGVGLGLVDVAKEFIQGPVDIAVGIYNSSQDFLSFCKNPNNKLTEWENYLKKHPFGIIQNYVNFERELPSFLLNQAKKSVDDFTKADTKTKSETATSFILNIALLFIPGSAFTKFGKAGEVAEVAGDIAKVEKGVETVEDIPKIEKGIETLEDAQKAAKAAKAAEAEKAAEVIKRGIKTTKELLKVSTCSRDELYKYLLKNVDSDAAKNFLEHDIWPDEIQIPKNSSVLNADGTINWDLAKKGGYKLDSNGTPIKKKFVPKVGEIIDRYGNANGRYTSPVVDGKSYTFTKRSLPYVEDLSNYHKFEVTGDFSKIEEYVSNCSDAKLKALVDAMVTKYYDDDYSKLISYQGEIAKVDGWGTGGGIQYEFPLTIDQLERLGLLKEIK